MRFTAAAATLLLSAGCTTMHASPQPERAYLADVELAVPELAATAGGTIPLVLTNGGALPVGYNLCLGGLERRSGDLWVPTLTNYKACSQVYAPLAPDDVVRGVAVLPASLESDDYRYVTEVTDLEGTPVPNLMRSNAFHVAAAPAAD